jgi:hypothetical protein
MSKKRGRGRPRTLPRELTRALSVRCSPKEYDRWFKYARSQGMSGASSFLRKAANDALATLTSKESA